MRIDIIKPRFYTSNNIQKNTQAKTEAPVTTPKINNFGAIPGLEYFVSFGGYKEDKAFVTATKQALDNTMQNIVNYYNEDNYDFQDAFEILQQNNIDEYNKVLNAAKNFKVYEERFNKFNETTLNSIKDVQYGKSQFGNYWRENSYIGNTKTSDIISASTGTNPEQNINEVLKNLDYEGNNKLREDLIVEWFKNETETINKSYEIVHQNNKQLFAILENRLGKFNAKKFLKQQESHYTSEFNKATIDKIFNNKMSNDQKLEAVEALLNYLENQLKTEDSKSMEVHLDTILNVQKHLKQGIHKESADYIENDFKALYNIAISDWQKNSLPTLINQSLTKAIYIDNAEKKTPVMLTIPGYSELSLNQKYFVAKYYEANNNSSKDNMLKQIIQDRDILDPSIVIDTLSLKIDSDRNKYFTQLDTFYDYLKNKQTNPDLEIPEISIAHRKDTFSFIDMYLFELDKLGDYFDKSTKDKLNYLSTLTQDELQLANNKIKQQWDENELQYLIESEVRKQAKLTSINSKMYEELKQINVNLNDIKIKIDNISFTLKDLLDNKYILKDETEMKKSVRNSSTVIANAERAYYAQTPQEQQQTDERIRESMPIVIDNLIQKTDDKDIIEKLTFMKSKCKDPKTKSNEIFGMLKTIAVGRALGMGMNKSCNGLSHLIQNAHNLHQPLADAGNLADIAQNGVDIGAQAAQSIALGTATHAAAHAAGQTAAAGGSLSSVFTAIPPIDPVTATIAITIAAAVTCATAASKATKLERQQRELYVEFSN
ncbi:MAG: hypothetical protein NC191_08555 [Muribaculaceae bacterium]|nr:hypothetical protein [Muribaculaceae bacterium]